MSRVSSVVGGDATATHRRCQGDALPARRRAAGWQPHESLAMKLNFSDGVPPTDLIGLVCYGHHRIYLYSARYLGISQANR
jgi:hypothetical protein